MTFLLFVFSGVLLIILINENGTKGEQFWSPKWAKHFYVIYECVVYTALICEVPFIYIIYRIQKKTIKGES